jgi:Ca2+-binding RTX toxin-like protein
MKQDQRQYSRLLSRLSLGFSSSSVQSYEGIWEKLSQDALKGAEYDSRERQPHPKCLKGTREVLLNHIYGLLDNREKNQLVWLHGTAGVGKSAVAFTVAKRMSGLRIGEQALHEMRLAGSFFFSRKHTKRCTTGYLFATLAYQLATNFPSIRNDVIRAIYRDPALLDPDKSLRHQRNALFLQPLRDLLLRLRDCPPLVFVIDALDECSPEVELSDLISLLGQTLTEPDLPAIHILLTSRSEAHISEALKEDEVRPLVCEIPMETPGERVAKTISLDGADVDDDIYVFLEHSCRKLQSRYSDFPLPTKDKLARLVSRAGGRFIVASTMMKFIGDGYADPRDRLQIMLELTSELLPGTEVYKLYDRILATCADPKRAYLHLSVVAALADPLPISEVSKLLGPGQGKDVETVLLQLRSIIYIPPDSSFPMNIYHSSVREYVSQPSHCSLLQVQEIQSPHYLLANSSLRLMHDIFLESTALRDALSELKKQSQAIPSRDPDSLKQSLSFVVQPPEPIQVLTGLLWLRGDRNRDNQHWLETQDGHAWLQTEGGIDWLHNENGKGWLQGHGGRDWLQTQGGKEWLQTVWGDDWLRTKRGNDWLQTQGGENWLCTQEGQDWLHSWGGTHWLETWWGYVWLQSQGGHDWLRTQSGHDWLLTQSGHVRLPTQIRPGWLETAGGERWLQTQDAQDWMRTASENGWLVTHFGERWLCTTNGRHWLQTHSGRDWLEATSGQGWLRTHWGKIWLNNPENDWLQTQGGQNWLLTPSGRHWLTKSGENWLLTRGGKDWLETQSGKDWLQTNGVGEFEWLQTQTGRGWLATHNGRDWLETQNGRDWLETNHGTEWLDIQSGREWLEVKYKREWLETQPGQYWLGTQSGRDWLETQKGRDWLQTENGKKCVENWMQTESWQDWLQNRGRGDWLESQSARDWLKTQKGRDWLLTQSGRDWLQTPTGRDWLQTPHGEAWQATLAASVWLTMEEFSSVLGAMSVSKTVPELPLQSAFQVIQLFKSLPDFLMFPTFLALRNPHHSIYALPQARLSPDRETIDAMKAFTTFANEARERSRSTSNALKYACQSWAFHLSRIPKSWDDSDMLPLKHVFKLFCDRNLISWLERQWCLNGLQSCLVILFEVEKLMKVHTFNGSRDSTPDLCI